MNISIRNALEADISHIENLIENGYRRDVARKGWTHEVDLLSGDRLAKGEIAALLLNNNAQTLVACDENNQVQGVISVSRDGDWIEFGKFAVNPELQGLGIGKKLINSVEEYVKNQWQEKILKLSVISTRIELIEFYKRLGFKETGQIIDFVKIHPYVILKENVPNLQVIIMEKAL